MEDELTENERRQMRRIMTLQKVVGVILLKRAWILLFVFAILSASFSAYFVYRGKKSAKRYEAMTRLLFNPRQTGSSSGVQNLTDRQLFSVLDRPSIKRKVASRMQLSPMEVMCLSSDLAIVQERQPPNLFTLTAQAPSPVNAVKKVNIYAEMLIDEYVVWRGLELENWRESIELRRKSILAQIAGIESEAATLKGKAGVVAPAEMLAVVNSLLSDQRKNKAVLEVELENEKFKKKKLEESLGGSGPAIVANATALKQWGEEISTLEKDIAQLREIYTDLNPKVAGKLSELNEKRSQYMKFIGDKGISNLAPEEIDRLEKTAGELAESSVKIESITAGLNPLEAEIRANERRAEELSMVIPDFERLKVKRADLEQSLRDLDEQLGRITYLHTSMRTDLHQIEQARGADDKNPYRAKIFVLAIAGAVFFTGGLAAIFIITGFSSGRVAGGREIAAYDEILFLGSLPRDGAMTENDAKDVLGVVSLKFASADIPKGTVLVCRLPGADWPPEFAETLGWSLAMSGAQSFTLDIVPHSEFVPPEGAEAMLNAMRLGTTGWFPVDNRFALAPTEYQMLAADLAELRKEYDHVFIRMPGGLRRGGSFFDQLLEVSDCAMFVIGAGKTPRNSFAYARKHVEKAKKPMIALVVDAPARDVHREMEARK